MSQHRPLPYRIIYRLVRVRDEPPRTGLMALPNELLVQILECLPAVSLLALHRTSQRLRDIVEGSAKALAKQIFQISKARLKEFGERPYYGNTVEEILRQFIIRHGLPAEYRDDERFRRDIGELIARSNLEYPSARGRRLTDMMVGYILKLNEFVHQSIYSHQRSYCGCTHERSKSSQDCLNKQYWAAEYRDVAYQNMLEDKISFALEDGDNAALAKQRRRIADMFKQLVQNVIIYPLSTERPEGDVQCIEHDFFASLPPGEKSEWRWDTIRRAFIDTADASDRSPEPCRLFPVSIYYVPLNDGVKQAAKQYTRLCGQLSWAPEDAKGPYAELLLARVWEGMRVFPTLWLS